MNYQPFISVIVPVYKVEKYLDKCVQSIVGQTYKNIEIILVDDGSPDNCPQMCDEWAKRDSRIKVIHKENGGQATARNRALDIADGDYFMFVDSDDWIAFNLCEEMIDILNKHDPDLIEFGVSVTNEAEEVYSSTEKITEGFLSTEKALQELAKGNIGGYVWNKVFRKELFSDIRFPEGRFYEDVAVVYKFFILSKSIYCYPKELYYYRQREGSTTRCDAYEFDFFLALYEFYNTVKGEYPIAGKNVHFRLVERALSVKNNIEFNQTAEAHHVELVKSVLSENRVMTGAIMFRRFLRKGKRKIVSVIKKIFRRSVAK